MTAGELMDELAKVDRLTSIQVVMPDWYHEPGCEHCTSDQDPMRPTEIATVRIEQGFRGPYLELELG